MSAPPTFPPAASSTRRRYYALRAHHPGGLAVAAGQAVARGCLGGRRGQHGVAPLGFHHLEDAVAEVIALDPESSEVRILWR